MNKTLILFILSLIIVIIQWVIFDVFGTIIIIFILIIWFKIFIDKWYKNYIKDIKSFLLNDDNFWPVFTMFCIVFSAYASNLSREDIIYTVVWYLVIAWCLFIFIDDKKLKEAKLEKDMEDFKGSLNEYANVNGLNDESDFWNTHIKDLLSEDEFKNFEDSIDEIRSDIDEMLELDEEKKDDLFDDIFNKVMNKEYDIVIQFHNSQLLQKYLVQRNNIKDLSEYNLLIGTSYQEVWDLKSADKCFDIFLNNLSFDSDTILSFKKQGITDIGVIKMMILIKRLQDFGLNYKMNKEQYEYINSKETLSANNKKWQK